jgi:hypothetical protein
MTAQCHENLILNGEETSMAFCPPLPENHPRLIELSNEEANKEDIDSIIFSTACWRQYIGTWMVEDEKFYLVSLLGRYKIVGDEPILADWFTGVLRIPKGELLHYVHMGFGSVYEQEIHIKIEQGIVTASRITDNRNKDFSESNLSMKNLPGFENNFPGDEDL